MAFWAPILASIAGAGASYLFNKDSGASQPTQMQSGSQNQQSLSQFTPNPMLNQAYANMLGQANYLSGTPTPYFPGQTYIGPSQYTQQGLAMGEQANPFFNQAANYANKGANALMGAAGSMGGINATSLANYNSLSNAADVANNPWVQGQIKANEQSVMDTLKEQMLPQLQAGATSVNALGSSRLGLAQGQAMGDSSKALSQTNASTMLNAYQQGLGAQQAALGYTGSMLNNATAPGQAMSAASSLMGQGAGYKQAGAMNALQGGQIVEDYQQKALQDAMDRYNYQYQEPWQRMQNTQSMLSGMTNLGQTYNGSTGNSQNASPNPNYMSPWQSAIGGAMAGYGMYNQYQQQQPSSKFSLPDSYWDPSVPLMGGGVR